MDIFETGTRLSNRANAIARNRGENPAAFMSMLCREQLLAAIGRLAPTDTVLLKGSAVALLDERIRNWARPSKDLDLHLHGLRVEDLQALLERAASELATLGIRLEQTNRKTLWKGDGTPGGEKVTYRAWLGKTRVDFDLDAWVGVRMSPSMRLAEQPSMLDGMPPVKMLAYPLEAMAADKLHAIAQFGSANTRRKDYYDLWHLASMDLDPALLAECVVATFASNGRDVPLTPVLLPGLGRTFAVDNQAAWEKMLVDSKRVGAAPADFKEVVGAVRAFANRAFGHAPSPEVRRELADGYEAAPALVPAYA